MLTVDGATVAEVLADARSRLGPGFAEVLDHSAVWLNGEPVEGSGPLLMSVPVSVKLIQPLEQMLNSVYSTP